MIRAGRTVAAAGVIALAAFWAGGCGGASPHASPVVHGERTLVRDGRKLFANQHCGNCHTLAAEKAHGAVGPDFDTSELLNRAQIYRALSEGANGMPSYAGRLSARQRHDVAEFLYVSTHPRGR